MNTDKIASVFSKFTASAASLLKVALMSKSVSRRGNLKAGEGIVIMGNGPSLRQTIDNDGEWLCSHDLMAVNFAANTPEFISLRPQQYMLADGHFFSGNVSDLNVVKLWEDLSRVSWEMTLWVPVKCRPLAHAFVMTNRNIRIKTFNLTPIEGYKSLRHVLFDAGMGMPRPRNVMIPAIMTAIREGYKKIYLCGADHSWTKTLDVDNKNFVVSVQPHFYQDNEKEHERVRATYKGLRLHDVLGSMTIAFRSYWDIAEYARARGVEILNATPGSMIDAFPRYLPGKRKPK